MGLIDSVSSFLGTKNTYQASPYQVNPGAYQMPNAEATRQQMMQQSAAAAQRQGPAAIAGPAPAATANMAAAPGMAGINQNQNALVQAQMARVAGQAPSVAQLQLQAGQDANMRAAMAAAASARGDVNPMVAQRDLQNNLMTANQQTNAQAAQLRAGEQQTAEQTAAQNLAAMAGQAQNTQQLGTQVNLSNAQAVNQQSQLAQAAQVANQQAALQQRGMNDALAQYYNTAGMTVDQTQLQAAMAQQAANQQAAMQAQQINAGVAGANTQANAQMLGGLMNAGASLGALAIMSDERVKTNVERAGVGKKLNAFLAALDPAEYDYRDPKHGAGRHFGIMAQSAAKTEVGRSFVAETPDGLALDTRRGFGVLLAAMKHLHDEQQRLKRAA